jgi:transposase
MYLMSSTRCGISAKQLERELGVTYKTAWRMFHMIRNELMTQDDDQLPAKSKWTKPMSVDTGKPPRAGSLPQVHRVRHGGARWPRVGACRQNASMWSLYPHIDKTVKTGSAVFTDEHQTYMNMPKARFNHEAITHKTGVFVSGNVHTQTIDGFWSLLKSGIRGVYHQVSPKHLQGYLNEYVWRYNHRDDDAAMFLQLILRAARPTYLTATCSMGACCAAQPCSYYSTTSHLRVVDLSMATRSLP